MIIPIIPEIAIATFKSNPNKTCNPNPAPPTLPMLKANPPIATNIATTYPNPGITLFAISWPLALEIHITLQMLT